MTMQLFFFNGTATTEIYTLSLHDALPICNLRKSRLQIARRHRGKLLAVALCRRAARSLCASVWRRTGRSEEHTSELQSRRDLVCRLLLEKKNHSDCLWLRSSRLAAHESVC